jgi:hypothetical protein
MPDKEWVEKALWNSGVALLGTSDVKMLEFKTA